MIEESKSQPSINLRLSVNKSDYEQLNLPEPTLNSSKLRVITDTGAQSSLIGIKAFRKHGFDESLIVPARKKMYAANEEGINILGAFFGRLGGQNKQGQFVETPEMIYVTESTDLFYLSRQAKESLRIIPPDFPTILGLLHQSLTPLQISLRNRTLDLPRKTANVHAYVTTTC